MSWVEKNQRTSFDNVPIDGLYYLSGDLLAQLFAGHHGFPFFNPEWLKGQKMPQVQFPSGQSFDIWETSVPQAGGIIHIFGEMDLPYFSTRDDAWALVSSIAEQVGYAAIQHGADTIEVQGHDTDEHYLITFDNSERRILDIAPIKSKPDERAEIPHEPLLDQASREKLPKLYTNERLGLNALAQVKFFTPDGNWTWYASEFDGKDTFFGLVAGLDTELGYFYLSELEQIRGNLGLPVERDRHFTPQTLKSLQRQHQERGG